MTIYTRENSGLPDNNITAMDIDRNGNLWIGTLTGGLAILGNVNITEIKEDKILTQVNYVLNQNYPNPFNPSTKIKYSIPKQGIVTLKVFDILGSEVKNLVDNQQSQGNYEVEFDGSNLATGIYLYRLQTGDFVETKKMILMK